MSKITIHTPADLAALVAERDQRISFQGEVWLDHRRNGEYLCFEEYQGKNIIPTEGLNYLLDAAIANQQSAITSWYVGIFKNNVTPLAADTASKLGAAGAYGECQDADYASPVSRPAFTLVAASGGVITNAASKAEFTISAGITVYGAFLTNNSSKTANTGKLLAAKKFDSARTVVSGDIISVVYQITALSS